MTKILAFDTSAAAFSVALFIDGEYHEHFAIAPRQHAQLILTKIDAMVAEAGCGLKDFDAIAFGAGPGSFTGLRIACSVAQGLAFGADKPVIPVSTLQALAVRAQREFGAERVITALDARMQEIYWGAYQSNQGLMQAMVEPMVLAPADSPILQGADFHGTGSGFDVYAALLSEVYDAQIVAIHNDQNVHAADVAAIAIHEFNQGRLVEPWQALPVYLRDQVVRG